MQIEMWAAIPGAENYDISILGVVRRRAGTYGRRSGRIIRSRVDRHGYVAVSLSLGEKGKYRYAQVHRLMAEAFLGPPPFPDAQDAHWDGDRQHNALGNIRWATPKDNAADRSRHGRTVGALKGAAHHNARLTDRVVVEMRRLKSEGFRLEEIAEEFGVGRTTVYDAVKGRTWGHVHVGV